MRGYLKALLQRRVPEPIRKWAQLVADRLPPSVRYGKPYKDALALLKESETWDEKTLVAYQEKRLQVLVNHCYANIPYYREVFQQNGLTPKDIQTVNDLQKLPFLTKEIVRKRKKDLIATNISFLNREEVSTSGSTGAPLDFYMDPTTRPMERALAFRHLSWLGYKKGDRLAVFKVPPLSDPKQFYQYLRRSGELRISFRDMDEPRLEKMVDLLEAVQAGLYKRMAFLALHTGQMDGKKQKDHSAAEIHRDGFREHVSAHDRADRSRCSRLLSQTFTGRKNPSQLPCSVQWARDIISRWRWG